MLLSITFMVSFICIQVRLQHQYKLYYIMKTDLSSFVFVAWSFIAINSKTSTVPGFQEFQVIFIKYTITKTSSSAWNYQSIWYILENLPGLQLTRYNNLSEKVLISREELRFILSVPFSPFILNKTFNNKLFQTVVM